MDSRILVTGYESLDLDGVACSLAYSRLLKYEGSEAIAVSFGTPHREAQFVMNQLEVGIPSVGAVADYDEVRLVDASDRRGISDEIDPASVIEVIDHREAHDPDAFPNAQVQVELVGAAATLIAERYRESGAPLTDNLANLLYSAVVSNTLNLRASVTTERDEDVVEWLKQIADVSPEITELMFEYKSKIDNAELRSVFDSDFASISVSGSDIGIVQLEILEVDDVVNKHQQEVFETLELMRDARCLDHIMLIGVDLEGRFDVLVSSSDLLQQSLEDVLETSFEDNMAITNGPILRKELIPQLSQELSNRM